MNNLLSFNQLIALNESSNLRSDESKHKKIVCVHWLKGQCKKSQDCEYLHVYLEDKVPTCRYFLSDGHCQKGSECVYRHVMPANDRRSEDCPYYDMGFCKLGMKCQMSHVNKLVCQDYSIGFCPRGPTCLKEHIKTVLSDQDLCLSILANFPDSEDWVDIKIHNRHEKSKLPNNPAQSN